MPRFAFLLMVLGLALSWSISQAADIAIIKSSSLPHYEQAVQGFRAGLPSAITVKEYNLDGQLATGREIGRALRASPPALVFSVGLKAAMAAKLEIFDTPVVFCMVLNPEAHALPAPNMTGIAVRPPADTQLAALQSTLPDRRRIGVLYDEGQSGEFIRQAHRMAKQLGVEILAVAVQRQEDIPQAIRLLLPRIDALWLIQDQTVISESAIPFLIESTLDAKVPMFTFSSALVQQGAIGALVLDPWAVGQQAAQLAISHIKGQSQSVGSMKIPERPQLALNLNSAEYFGITVNPELIRLAGQLYSGPGALAQRLGHGGVIP